MRKDQVSAIGLAACLALLVTAGKVGATCKLTQLASLPVTMVGREPIVPGKINGQDVQFIADTGTSYSFLTPGNVAQLHLPVSAAPFGVTAETTDGPINLSVASVKNLVLAGAEIGRTEFLVSDNEYGYNNVGLLAQNVLGIADSEFDLSNGVIKLIKSEGCSNQPIVYWTHNNPYSVVDLEEREEMRLGIVTPPPAATAYLNGKRILVTFDTGAATSTLSLEAAARAGLRPDSPGVSYLGARAARHKMRKYWLAHVESFKIGDEEIKNTNIYFADIKTIGSDMLLGNDFFLSHHLFIANSQHKVYFTYVGGPVFSFPRTQDVKEQSVGKNNASVDSSGEGSSALNDADSYSRRGQARLARRDMAGALADLDRAVSLAPSEPRYLQERGVARLEAGQKDLAREDFEQALQLKPDFLPALIARGEMRLNAKDEVGAVADFDAADRAAAKPSDLRLLLGGLYSRAERYDRAITQYDLWIATHPEDSRQPQALNGRCWARAQLGQDLGRALSDCNASLRRLKTAAALDSRGLVELRLGAYDRAIDDYDAALTMSPKMAWSLYGRGIAKVKTGHAAEGQADMAAAAAINPSLPALAKAHGVTPP